MTDLLKFQPICEIIQDERSRQLAAELNRDDSVTLVRHPDDEVNPNAVAVHHRKYPIAWIPLDILEDLAACLDKGLVADASVMRILKDDFGDCSAIEVLIFLEPPETKEKPVPKRRLAADEKDRSDLVAGLWVGLGAIVVLALILFFLYWMLVRPALRKTTPGAVTTQLREPLRPIEDSPFSPLDWT